MDENTIKDDAVDKDEVTPVESEDLDDDTLEETSGGRWGGAEISEEQPVARKQAWLRWG